MRGVWRGVGAVAVTLSLLVAAGCGGSSPSTRIGTVADSGFRPAANGLPFQNYGAALSDGAVPVNLTAADVQKLFGDRVCADAKLRRCDLIPEAQAWLNDINQAMAGGHCFGFSVLAELVWQGKLNVHTLGAATTTGLAIDDNQTLQRTIAYDWALQTLQSVQATRVTGTPDQILAKLESVLKPHPSQTYTIALWKRDGSGGHAVTPYAVENKGSGKFQVMIYDNNWPGQTRAINFDTKANTWTYAAAVNPGVPDSVYEGDAQTKTISLFPTSPGLGTQPCPFCAIQPTNGSAKAGNNTEEISLLGSTTEHATLVVTDDAGRRLGYINGSLVNEIPGAHVDQVISAGLDGQHRPELLRASRCQIRHHPRRNLPERARHRDPGHHRPQLRPVGQPDSHPARRQGHPGHRARRHPSQLHQFSHRVPYHNPGRLRQSGRLLLPDRGYFRPAR